MSPPAVNSTGNATRRRNFVLASFALVLCFTWPLWQLVQVAWHSSLLSYILLVPAVSAYLIWIKRGSLPPIAGPDLKLTITLAGAGIALLAGFSIVRLSGIELPQDDALAILTLSFVCFVVALNSFFWGRAIMRALAFPFAFLVFITPLPEAVVSTTETFLQHGSADAAYLFLKMSGTPVLRDELLFMLPGIKLEVAPECSGIHSSLVLLLTSLVASHLFLRTRWKKAVLVLVVIPLALLRNGLRIFVIGELCVRIGPEMIHSAIHRRGGPIFFIISLVPLALLLYALVRSERRAAPVNHRSS